jgi:hypothetical protein
VTDIWNKYVDKTPQRVKLLDSFMAFLGVVGVLQFVYCVIVGNFVRLRLPSPVECGAEKFGIISIACPHSSPLPIPSPSTILLYESSVLYNNS